MFWSAVGECQSPSKCTWELDWDIGGSLQSFVSICIYTYFNTFLILFLHSRSENEDTSVEYAVKVFKTTLAEFHNREQYIKDDYRFKNRFKNQNPRKLIPMWAEKEMRNLQRSFLFLILFSVFEIIYADFPLIVCFYSGKKSWNLAFSSHKNVKFKGFQGTLQHGKKYRLCKIYWYKFPHLLYHVLHTTGYNKVLCS